VSLAGRHLNFAGALLRPWDGHHLSSRLFGTLGGPPRGRNSLRAKLALAAPRKSNLQRSKADPRSPSAPGQRVDEVVVGQFNEARPGPLVSRPPHLARVFPIFHLCRVFCGATLVFPVCPSALFFLVSRSTPNPEVAVSSSSRRSLYLTLVRAFVCCIALHYKVYFTYTTSHPYHCLGPRHPTLALTLV